MAKEGQVNTQQETNPKDLFLQAEKHFQNLDFLSMPTDEQVIMIGDCLKNSSSSLYFLEQVEKFYKENRLAIDDPTYQDRYAFYRDLVLDQLVSVPLKVFALRLILEYHRRLPDQEFINLSAGVDSALLSFICGSAYELDKFVNLGMLYPVLGDKFQGLIAQELTKPEANPLIVMFGTSPLFRLDITDRQPYLDYLNNLTDEQMVDALNDYPKAGDLFLKFLDEQSIKKFLNRDIYTASFEALVHLVKELYFINDYQLLDLFFTNFFNTYQHQPTSEVETTDSAEAPQAPVKYFALLSSFWRHLNSEMDLYNPALDMFSARMLEFLGLPYQQAFRAIERFKQAQPTKKDGKIIPQHRVELEACITNVSQALEFTIAWQNLAKEQKLPSIDKSPLQLLMESGISVFARHEVKTMINNIFATHGKNLDPRTLVDREAIIYYVAEKDYNGAITDPDYSKNFFEDVNLFSDETIDAIVVDGPIANLLIIMGKQRSKRNGLRKHSERKPWLNGVIWNEHGLETSMGTINAESLNKLQSVEQRFKRNFNRDFTPNAVVLLDACLVGAEIIDVNTGRFVPSLSDLLAHTLDRKVYAPTGKVVGINYIITNSELPDEKIKIIPRYRNEKRNFVRARTSFPNPKTTS